MDLVEGHAHQKANLARLIPEAYIVVIMMIVANALLGWVGGFLIGSSALMPCFQDAQQSGISTAYT